MQHGLNKMRVFRGVKIRGANKTNFEEKINDARCMNALFELATNNTLARP
jgi:hypothetical protein